MQKTGTITHFCCDCPCCAVGLAFKMPWGGVFQAKYFFSPSFRFCLAYSLSKSFYDFGFRSTMYFFGRYKTPVFKSNGDFADEIIHNGLPLLICNQTAFIGFPSIHAVNHCQRFSAYPWPLPVDFVHVHRPNLPMLSNRSLIADFAFANDCLSISIPTFR